MMIWKQSYSKAIRIDIGSMSLWDNSQTIDPIFCWFVSAEYSCNFLILWFYNTCICFLYNKVFCAGLLRINTKPAGAFMDGIGFIFRCPTLSVIAGGIYWRLLKVLDIFSGQYRVRRVKQGETDGNKGCCRLWYGWVCQAQWHIQILFYKLCCVIEKIISGHNIRPGNICPQPGEPFTVFNDRNFR